MMSAPRQFYEKASYECREYLRENRDEWRATNDETLQEFRETMVETLFNTNVEFRTVNDCLAFIGNDARLIFDLVDYVADQDSNYGEPLSDTDLLSKFNYCMYFVGSDMILSDDGWVDIISAYRHWYDSDTDTDYEDSSDETE